MFDVYSNVRSVDVSGVSISVADHGPEDGVPVLMIHGFPDSARLWRNQIPVLVEAGYRVLATDLRGFGRSDKPKLVEDYRLRTLAADMVTVLEELGAEKAHVVGHDWGSALSWYLAISSPDRLRSLAALSAGHPTAFANAGFRQREKSWYMLLFQFEEVAEKWLSQNDWAALRSWSCTNNEADHWIEDLSRPEALTAALNIYRANSSPQSWVSPAPKLPDVSVPTMGVWSTGDMALIEDQMTASEEFVSAEWKYHRIEGASHWIPLDRADELNHLLLDWFGSH